MGLVNSEANSVLDHYFGKANHTAPAQWYLGASTTAPAADGSNITEPVGNGYARVAVTPALFDVAGTTTARQIENNADIQFPQAVGNSWGTITHLVFFLSPAGNDPVFTVALSIPRAVPANDILRFPAGSIPVTVP